ncbi:MAG TPA: hypothetical protein VNF29_03995 [Candidatus Binataceae bacterium]|nr:hypothetical protein [Candidatus Binataceae bacterium]
MLLDGRLRGPAAQLLDVSRNRKRVNLVEFEPPVLAPVEELFYRACIGGARVAVTDAGGEEFAVKYRSPSHYISNDDQD